MLLKIVIISIVNNKIQYMKTALSISREIESLEIRQLGNRTKCLNLDQNDTTRIVETQLTIAKIEGKLEALKWVKGLS